MSVSGLFKASGMSWTAVLSSFFKCSQRRARSDGVDTHRDVPLPILGGALGVGAYFHPPYLLPPSIHIDTP